LEAPPDHLIRGYIRGLSWPASSELTCRGVAQQCAAVVGVWRHRKVKIRPALDRGHSSLDTEPSATSRIPAADPRRSSRSTNQWGEQRATKRTEQARRRSWRTGGRPISQRWSAQTEGAGRGRPATGLAGGICRSCAGLVPVLVPGRPRPAVPACQSWAVGADVCCAGRPRWADAAKGRQECGVAMRKLLVSCHEPRRRGPQPGVRLAGRG
jgi:hypothetical protein